MNKQNRTFLSALLLILMLLLVACGGSDDPVAAVEPTEAPLAAAPTEPPAVAADTPTSAPVEAAAPVQPDASSAIAPEVAARADKYSQMPGMTLNPAKFYYATLKTAKGTIKVQLFAERTPITVNSFVFLAKEGYYDNTTFHRVLDGFMAQAGDPTGTGMGGPGYQFEDEIVEGLTFDRPALLAMANAGPGTNGSQFFITFAPTDWLNGKHTIFGEVIEGQDVLPLITRRDPSDAGAGDAIESITIEESDASTLPTPLPPPPTPTPFAPTSLDASTRPLAAIPAVEKSNYFNESPDRVIEDGKRYTATMITSQGTVTIALRSDIAPKAVNNFVVLADLGFYDNTPVNLVQGAEFVVIGAPANRPDSDAGYSIAAETNLQVQAESGLVAYVPKEQAADFILASSSQLVIALNPPPPDWVLQYSFFGKVIGGADILPKLTVSDTIQSITIAK